MRRCLPDEHLFASERVAFDGPDGDRRQESFSRPTPTPTPYPQPLPPYPLPPTPYPLPPNP